MKKELIDKFVKDPQWVEMEDFIVSYFETSTDINDIDTSNSSETVHAEVIARKRIAMMVAKLKNAFEMARKRDNITREPLE